MKAIERLLQEYKIRFRDTELIKRDGYPFKDRYISNHSEGGYEPIVCESEVWNINGQVYGGGGKWATADLKEKPDKWVVERDESHPVWEKFVQSNKFDCCEAVSVSTYFGNYGTTNREYVFGRGSVLDFKDHQYLTLYQWAEFFLPKVDFSILNDTDVFYLKSKQDDYLFTGGNPITKKVKGCTVEDGFKFIDRICDKNNVMELRKADDIEKEYYYTLYPELRPIKVGDWVAVWDDKDIESLFICKYKNVRNDPDWDNIVKVDITDNVMEQIDEFLKQQTK